MRGERELSLLLKYLWDAPFHVYRYLLSTYYVPDSEPKRCLPEWRSCSSQDRGLPLWQVIRVLAPAEA